MSRSVARCECCHTDILRHQADGTIEIVVGSVSRLIVDPTAHEGVNVAMTCRCGARREWIVRERVTSMGAAVSGANRVHYNTLGHAPSGDERTI